MVVLLGLIRSGRIDMLTMLAYDLLSVISCGEATVHTLHLGVVARCKSKEGADELLLNGLLELCDRGLINWKYHPDYSDKPAIEKTQASVGPLLETWRDVFEYLGPRTEQPILSTISVETSKKANLELQRDEYRIYEEYMDKWYS